MRPVVELICYSFEFIISFVFLTTFTACSKREHSA